MGGLGADPAVLAQITAGTVAGGAVGYVMANGLAPTQLPETVALFHSLVGAAATTLVRAVGCALSASCWCVANIVCSSRAADMGTSTPLPARFSSATFSRVVRRSSPGTTAGTSSIADASNAGAAIGSASAGGSTTP